jgi:cyclase
MLRSRIIPCLLIHNGGLVKTIQFLDPKYVGDPLNAVKIFNEKEVDELMVIDIDATVNRREPNYKLIENLAAECRMPLCYGGGINTPEQVEKIIGLGVEKVAIGSACIYKPELLSEASKRVGSQSIVAVIDVKNERVYINNGKISTSFSAIDLAKKVENLGAGEIVFNSIERDGTLKGYDFKLIDQIRPVVNIPITFLGGAGSFYDIKELISRYGIIGAAAGSIFVFKGKFRAVLIQYPNPDEKEFFFNSL